MPPKKTTDATGSDEIMVYTSSETKLITAIMETIPRSALNYEALAEKLGSASVNAARMRVTAAVGKYTTWFTGSAQEDGVTGGKPRAKRTPKKKAPSDDDEGIEQETPSKKKARTAKPKPKPKAAAQEEDAGLRREKHIAIDC
ncbi:hypothetical protein CSOJ01_15822 [Colletotrichum sojae]|uniref:Uncharacterized protein n=1 Tax=Colletotrichum sojae TaxID=2175907 RepID=A0A8H6MGB3_9PEZI|nr:hypothetical protein CSOJ01_15822 [Colletotrichum sojae]